MVVYLIGKQLVYYRKGKVAYIQPLLILPRISAFTETLGDINISVNIESDICQ